MRRLSVQAGRSVTTALLLLDDVQAVEDNAPSLRLHARLLLIPRGGGGGGGSLDVAAAVIFFFFSPSYN